MNIGEASIKYRTSVLVLTVVFVLGGLFSYQNMGRLEDPEFTIKQAQVITPFPGATPVEVESQVSDVLERAVQQLGTVDEVRSTSRRGRSIIDVVIKDTVPKGNLPQVWDELRRKIGDVQSRLPSGAGPSNVYDDYGDVYGVFFAISGDGYSFAELHDLAKYLQRELLLVDDVAKINLVGVQPEAVYIDLSPARMARFGVSRDQIYSALQNKNLVVDAGTALVGDERVALRPTGVITSVDEIGELLVGGGNGEPLVYLRDIATVSRGYVDPPSFLIEVDGKPSIGLAISTVSGGNVVTMGNAIKERMEEIADAGLLPFGVEFHPISIQSDAVTTAISGFISSLFQAVAIVIVVLLLFMGMRSGIIIGIVLLVTIIGTFIPMYMMGVMLERISLGALIIALGMLVDNAIVITEGMLIRIQRGEDRTEAAGKVVSQNAMPLFGATVVAILAFAAIGASNDSSGEFTRSLFLVILISLSLSWVTAITLTPVLCAMFLEGAAAGASPSDNAYDAPFFRFYRQLLVIALRLRWVVIGVMVGLLLLSLYGFGFIRSEFFPASTRPQFMVDVWLREGTDIEETKRVADEAATLIREKAGVTGVTNFVGQGPPRFLLTLSPESGNSAYAFLLVDVEDYRTISRLSLEVQSILEERLPQAICQTYKFALGPGDANKIQIRVKGPGPEVLRGLASQVMEVMYADGNLIGIQTDWRTPVKEYQPLLLDTQARQLGIERPSVANLIKETFEGRAVGSYREGDNVLPLVVRAPEEDRENLGSIRSLEIRSPATGESIPLAQIVSGYETALVDPIIKRRDRQRTIIIKSNPRSENASVVFNRIRPGIEAIDIPLGCTLEFGGEYESSKDANEALGGKVVLFGFLMIIVVIVLFNKLVQPLIIWLCVPLAVIGVTIGLLATNQPFGFMALLGLLSLSGMLIKNAIVLVDEIDLQIREGNPVYTAILDSGVSRMRPVMMAASTTVLGMLPLVVDAFFVAMAVTIMAGLTFASILTLVIVPVLYAIFFKARPE